MHMSLRGHAKCLVRGFLSERAKENQESAWPGLTSLTLSPYEMVQFGMKESAFFQCPEKECTAQKWPPNEPHAHDSLSSQRRQVFGATQIVNALLKDASVWEEVYASN